MAAGWFSGDWKRAVDVLVVATPCPLIIAAPVAFVGGISRAAKERIIIRNGAALESLARAQTIAFDKTGTITTGGASVIDVRAVSSHSPAEILAFAAAADSVSSHIFALALREAAQSASLPIGHVVSAHEVAGEGVTAIVDGHHVALGRRAFVRGDAPRSSRDPRSSEPRWCS